MESSKNKIVGKYKSETGAILYFTVNDTYAEEYGLRNALLSFIRATNEFFKCRTHWDNLVKAKVLKMPKKKAEFEKVLKEDHIKGMGHLKKARPLINKAFNELKEGKKKFKLSEEDFKTNIMNTEKKLKEELMYFDLSPIEIKIVLIEFRKSKRIIETEGRTGLIKHFNSRFEEMMDIGADPLNAWKHHSVPVVCVVILVILAICIIATILQIKNTTSFVCADPHGSWDGHLDGAFSEGDQIEGFLNSHDYSVTLKKHPVSKADFLANIENKIIVHLAGHGGYSGGQVYFCFDNGDVYPNDISALNSVPTELFYAGVCFGGVNSTMANIFINKGTKNYIGFTKSIPDWDAKYFGDLFYENWKVDGKDIRTALDEADDYYPDLNCWVVWGA